MIKLNWIEEKQWPPRVCPATTNSVKIKHRLDWIGNWIRVELYCSFMHYTKYNSEPRKQLLRTILDGFRSCHWCHSTLKHYRLQTNTLVRATWYRDTWPKGRGTWNIVDNCGRLWAPTPNTRLKHRAKEHAHDWKWEAGDLLGPRTRIKRENNGLGSQ